MTLLQSSVLGLLHINFAIFIIAAIRLFDPRHATVKSRLFVVSFWTLYVILSIATGLHITSDAVRLLCTFVLLCVSLAIFLAAWRATRAKPFTVIFSGDTPEQLVLHGVYRFIRHPFYSAYNLSFIAGAVSCNHNGGAFCAVLAIALYIYAAREEEQKFANSRYAMSYCDYRTKAGMFWPKSFKGYQRGDKPSQKKSDRARGD